MTGPWVSGESLSPSRLNAHAGAATLLTGFSTDTVQGQSGNTVNVVSDLSAQNVLAGQHLELGGAPSSASGIASIRAHSQQTDYLFFQDAAGIKSNFLLGLKTGDSSASNVDGLNLFDVSDNTMIVRFSSDSVRFYPPIVAPVFDSGGALSSTYNAALFLRGSSRESQVQAAITAAAADGISRVYVPANLYPYNAAIISFDTRVQMVREGGNWSVYDVVAYGSSYTGGQDAAPAFQAAELGRAGAGGVLEISAGTYLVNSTINATANSIFWRGTPSSIVLCNTTGPAFNFSNTTTNIRYLVLDGLRVSANTAAHRVPLISIGTSGQPVSRFAIRNIVLDAVSLNRDGIRMTDSFDGTVDFVTFENYQAGGPGIRIESPTLNTGNLHLNTCQSTTNPILFLFNENPQTNLLSCLHVDNCKLARRPDLSTNTFFAGTIRSSPSSGVTQLPLQAGQGASYSTDGWIVVNNGSNTWVDKIASISGDTLNLTATLPFSMVSGDPVVTGYWHSVVGNNVKAVRWTLPQFEICNGIIGFGAQAGMIDMPLLGTHVKRVLYAAKNVQGYEVNCPIGFSSALSADCVILHQANDINNARNRVRGPVKIGSSGAVLQRDGGFTGPMHVDRLGGTATCLGTWRQDTTVAASQSNVTLVGPSGAARSLRMRSRGVLTAMVMQVSAARTASILNANVFINGVASNFSAKIDGTNSSWTIWEQKNDSATAPFAPGDLVDVRVTSDSTWTPTSNDLDVSLYADT